MRYSKLYKIEELFGSVVLDRGSECSRILHKPTAKLIPELQFRRWVWRGNRFRWYFTYYIRPIETRVIRPLGQSSRVIAILLDFWSITAMPGNIKCWNFDLKFCQWRKHLFWLKLSAHCNYYDTWWWTKFEVKIARNDFSRHRPKLQ
jgi:hypothetical protein